MKSIHSTDLEKIKKELTESEPECCLHQSDKLKIYPNWCKGCGICWQLCPTHTLKQGRDGKAAIAEPEKCTGCLICELHCPDYAIIVTATKAKK